MFGDRFAAEELARNFQSRMSKLQSLKKQAAEAQQPAKAVTSKVAQVKPEDFLVAPPDVVDVHGDDLDSKIKEVSSYAEDGSDMSCHKCNESYAKDSEHTCNSSEDGGSMEMPLLADDMNYLIDTKAHHILFELGKIASALRLQKQSFAADMVEVTALEIKQATLAKAAKKLEVVTGLQKMASESYAEGDRLTGDVISVTIENVKKS